MAIVSVTKSWSRKSSQFESRDGLEFRARFQEGWQVEHSADAKEIDIIEAPGMPRLRDFYEDTQIPCVSVGPVNKLGPVFSIVLVTYEGEAGPTGAKDSPENMEPFFEWSDTASAEPIDEDWNGNPIVTANNEPINGVTMEIADQLLTIERNYASFSPWITHQYRHSTNSDTFVGYPAGTARLTRFTAKSERYSNGHGYWKVNATIQFRYPYNTTSARAWYARVRHEGYKVRVIGKNDPVHAVDADGDHVSKPVLLDANGFEVTNPNNATWLEWQRYGSLPYSALGLYP